MLIRRAITSGRLTPAALAILTAAFTLGIQPTGLIAVAALVAGGRPILRIFMRRRKAVGTWPLLLPMLAAGTVILTVVFADQTLATVLEATRIRTAIGPSQAWYTENLRYYYLILPTVDGSLSRRFRVPDHRAVPLHVDVHHVAAQANSGCGPRAGLAADGRHLRHDVLPDVHPDQVGAPLRPVRGRRRRDGRPGHRPGVREMLRRPRNRMTFLTALFFVLALCWATTNGWWYVSSYGVPFNNAMPRIAGITISTVFLGAVRAVRDLHGGWFRAAGPRRRYGEPTADGGAGAAGGGASWCWRSSPPCCRRGAPVPDLLQCLGQPARVHRRLRAGRRRLVEPDANAGFLTALPGSYGPLGPLGGTNPVGFTPNGVPEHIVAEAIRLPYFRCRAPTTTGTVRSNCPPAGSMARPCRCPTGSIPRVPLAASFTDGPQQQATLESAWYQLPPADDGHPLVVVTAAGTIAGNSVANNHTDGQAVELRVRPGGARGAPIPAGRLVPYDLGPIRRGATCATRVRRYPPTRRWSGGGRDRSLSRGDWVAVTPPRCPNCDRCRSTSARISRS